MALGKSLRGIFGLDAALYVLLLLAAGFSVWSGHRFSQLQQAFAKATHDLSHFQVGDWLPRTELPVLQDPSVIAKVAAPGNDGQVLYFFSPACRYCQASQPYAEGLFELVQRQGNVEMYAVSMESEASTRKYLAETGSRIPTVVMAGEREQNLYRVTSVPALITVNRDGQVTHTKFGMLTSRDGPFAPPSASRSMDDR